MPDYSVAALFKVKRDEVTPAYDRMSRAADRMNRRTSSAFRNATKEGYKFGTIVKGILAANIIRGGIGAISNGLNRGITDFLKFEDVMVGAIARFDDLGPTVLRNKKFVDDFSKQVRQLTIDTRFGVADSAGALNELAKGGYTSAASIGVLQNLMQFATAAQEDLTDATNMSLNILNGFGLADKDVQKQIANHIQLNDKLTKTALLSTGGLRDMFETLKMTAPLSQELGMTVDEVLALGVVLDNAGVKGTEAATALKRGWMNIYAGKMTKEFKANGIEIADSSGRLLKYNDILTQIINKFRDRKLTQAQQIPILERIFGMYGLSGNLKIFAKLRDGLGEIATLQGKIEDSTGITSLVANAQDMSTFAKLTMLGNAALEKMFMIIDDFKYRGRDGVMALKQAIIGWQPDKAIQFINGTVTALTKMSKILMPMAQYLPEVVVAWATFKTISTGWKIAAFATDIGLLSTNLAVLGVELSGVAASLTTIAAAAAAAGGWYYAIRSAITGEDNPISQFAQRMGLVPNLQTGVASGPMSAPQAPWLGKGSRYDAPNSAESEFKSMSFNGQLNITGAPKGSTFTQEGSAPMDVNLLGVAP